MYYTPSRRLYQEDSRRNHHIHRGVGTLVPEGCWHLDDTTATYIFNVRMQWLYFLKKKVHKKTLWYTSMSVVAVTPQRKFQPALMTTFLNPLSKGHSYDMHHFYTSQPHSHYRRKTTSLSSFFHPLKKRYIQDNNINLLWLWRLITKHATDLLSNSKMPGWRWEWSYLVWSLQILQQAKDTICMHVRSVCYWAYNCFHYSWQ